MKKRINLRLILIAGIAVIVTMVCMTGIYYKLFQGQVRKDLQINARLLSGTGLFDDPDNTNVSLSEYYNALHRQLLFRLPAVLKYGHW